MRFYLTVLFYIFLQPSVAFALPNSIAIVADSWCPYNCEPASDKLGYVVDISKAIFEPEGIKVEYKVTPWARAIKATRRGKYTAVICATKNEAPDFVFPANIIGHSVFGFFTRPNSDWKFTSTNDIHDYTLGVVEGYSYDERIDFFIHEHKDHQEHIQIVGGNLAAQQNIKKLLAKRIDIMLEDINVVNHTLQEMHLPPSSLRMAGHIDKTSDDDERLYLAFSPNHAESQELAQLFDKGIERLRRNGTLTKILARYHLKDWK